VTAVRNRCVRGRHPYYWADCGTGARALVIRNRNVTGTLPCVDHGPRLPIAAYGRSRRRGSQGFAGQVPLRNSSSISEVLALTDLKEERFGSHPGNARRAMVNRRTARS